MLLEIAQREFQPLSGRHHPVTGTQSPALSHVHSSPRHSVTCTPVPGTQSPALQSPCSPVTCTPVTLHSSQLHQTSWSKAVASKSVDTQCSGSKCRRSAVPLHQLHQSSAPSCIQAVCTKLH